jgi:CelD/BcsL family acetyltransferase involved in cellulose biosynthesis
VEVIGSTEGLARLRPEWDELLSDSTSDGLFLTWEWLATWWRHLAFERRLHVVVVRQEERVLAIAPLACRPAGVLAALPFATLEFMGSGSVGSDYLDVIVRRGAEAAALPVLAAHLQDCGRVVDLGSLRAGASASGILGGILGSGGWSVRSEPAGWSRYIDLGGLDWESYLARLGRAHRADFRRKLRHLHRDFRVTFETVADEEGRDAALHRLFALHRLRWRGRGASDALPTSRHARFHQEFSRLACARGWIRLHTLRLDGMAVAALYVLRYRGVHAFYQSGFDPAYARYSTGVVAMGMAIEHAFEEGAREFDLLPGSEAYKERWARDTRALERLELYPPQWRGRLCRRVMSLSRAARRAARRVLPRAIALRLAFGRRQHA